ncbi:major facilitator superfamily domain-containing protein [Xylaria digitata]|nr:major facilitator superfamily domain-containing protein [Xylaria digitata]
MSIELDPEKGAHVTTPVVVELTTEPNLDSEPATIVSPQEAEPRRVRHDLYGYLKVAGLFCVYFITLGQLAAFSTYQDYYEENLLAAYSPSTISWIGTTQVFLLGIVGLYSGALYDRGYTHEALIPGYALIVLGLLLLSFSCQYWHVLLSQGFLIGIGGGLAYIPAISIVTHNFAARPALALGIAATGSAIGGIIWPIVFRRLLASVGFAWTNRVFTFLVLALTVASYFALTSHSRLPQSNRQRPKYSRFLKLFSRSPKDENGDESDSSAVPGKRFSTLLAGFQGRAYQFLCVGVFFALLGYWVPLFYLVPYASRSLGTSETYASDLLSILNAASLFGRIIPAAVGHKVGAANILLAGATLLGILIIVWMSIESIAGVTVWAIFLGFTAGSVITIPNAVASRLSHPSTTGLRIGIMWAVGAFAELIGPPIAGALLTKHNGQVSYLGCQIFGGLSVLIGVGFLVFPAWWILKDDKRERQMD